MHLNDKTLRGRPVVSCPVLCYWPTVNPLTGAFYRDRVLNKRPGNSEPCPLNETETSPGNHPPLSPKNCPLVPIECRPQVLFDSLFVAMMKFRNENLTNARNNYAHKGAKWTLQMLRGRDPHPRNYGSMEYRFEFARSANLYLYNNTFVWQVWNWRKLGNSELLIFRLKTIILVEVNL